MRNAAQPNHFDVVLTPKNGAPQPLTATDVAQDLGNGVSIQAGNDLIDPGGVEVDLANGGGSLNGQPRLMSYVFDHLPGGGIDVRAGGARWRHHRRQHLHWSATDG